MLRGFWPVPALLVAALIYAALDPGSGIRTWLRMRDDLRAAEVRVGQLREEVAALERDAQSLAGDRFALERAIREDLGWARPGETIVRTSRVDDSKPRFP